MAASLAAHRVYTQLARQLTELDLQPEAATLDLLTPQAGASSRSTLTFSIDMAHGQHKSRGRTIRAR